MCPNISPKKTWEGAIGGTLVAVIIATLLAFFYRDFSQIFGPEKAKTLFHESPFLKEYLVDRLGDVG